MISKNVFDICVSHGYKVAFSESVTGGSLAYELIKNEGASKVILGSLIVYSNFAKELLLNIPISFINTHGVVSDAVVKRMASSTFDVFQSDISIATTGNAGHESQINSEPKTIFIDILFRKEHHVFKRQYVCQKRQMILDDLVGFVYGKIEEIIG